MIVDHDHQRVLEVLENREEATVSAYLKAGKENGLLAYVEEVTTDMWDAMSKRRGKHLARTSRLRSTGST